MLFCFHLKKNATENQRMLPEAYGDYTPSISTCEYWFRRYKKGDFDRRQLPDQPKKFEDEKVEALFDQEPSQTQEKLAESLNVDQQFPDVWRPLEWFKEIGGRTNWS